MKRRLTGLLALACYGCTLETPDTPMPEPTLIQWADLTSRDRPDPSATYSYGDQAAQIVDLWLPEGSGPHPVVLMIHGGCWQKSIADRTLMNYAAEDLRQRGLAVWNIEYRGVDEPGGGYPGTFLDVSAAADRLIELGPELNLKVDEIVGFGHSAGGHLIAWLATRANLPAESVLATDQALPLSTIVISGGLADLEASAPITLDSCLANILEDLTGQASSDRPNVYADTSPAELLPTATTLLSVNGDRDRIAPPLLGESLTEAALAQGAAARYVESPQSGHVELIAPGTAAFETQAQLLLEAALAEEAGTDPTPQ